MTILDTGFRPDRLAQIRRVEEDHFWFVARREMVGRVISQLERPNGPGLDVGCGTGRNLALLSAAGHPAVGIDYWAADPDGQVCRASTNALPVAASSMALVTALDVLEHVDDVAALDQIGKVLKPGGGLVVTVPAHQWMWSHRDVDAGHLRRYSASRLRATLEGCGFEVAELASYQWVLLPVLAASRLAGRRRPGVRDAEDRPGPVVNRTLAAITRVESALFNRGIRPKFGSSLVAGATRR